MKIYHANEAYSYSSWIPDSTIAKTIFDADLLLLPGGVDVNPAKYGEPMGKFTQAPNAMRDRLETSLFETAVELDIPILGICRGAQLSCVEAGGRLIQHQENPHFLHPIYTSDGKKLLITSTHHQAQYPYDMNTDNYKLLAWTEKLSPYHLNGDDLEISYDNFKEAEIVYYPKKRALAIQGHPEMAIFHTKRNVMKAYPGFDKTFNYLYELLDKLMTNSNNW